jgi:hypothetical protein
MPLCRPRTKLQSPRFSSIDRFARHSAPSLGNNGLHPERRCVSVLSRRHCQRVYVYLGIPAALGLRCRTGGSGPPSQTITIAAPPLGEQPSLTTDRVLVKLRRRTTDSVRPRPLSAVCSRATTTLGLQPETFTSPSVQPERTAPSSFDFDGFSGHEEERNSQIAQGASFAVPRISVGPVFAGFEAPLTSR